MRQRILLPAYRLLLRTGRTPLRRVWLAGYRLAAWLAATYLMHGERGDATYLRAGLASGDFVPGLSDIDLLLVCDPDPGAPGAAARRIHARHQRLTTASRAVELLLDRPLVFEADELPDVTGANTSTFGLPETGHTGKRVAVYSDGAARVDHVRMTELPGLYSTTRQWRHLRGRRLALDEPPRSPEQIRLAAWLELLYWWRVAFAACAGDFGPRGGYTSAKLIAEPARIWILLEHGEKHAERARALERAIELLPEEADSFRLGLDLHRTAAEMPPMRLAEVLPVLAQLSHRIVAILSHLAVADGLTEARLVGTRDELTPTWIDAPAPHPDARALCDWRGIVSSHHGDEWFVETDWEATDPAAIHRATMLQDGGGYYALRSGPLFVFPGPTWERTRRRGIESTFSDPVTFALAAGHETAFFPNHPGFCLNDVTRRALAERRAWLQRPTQETTIADLLLAARAALIRESFAGGAPLIPVTLAATARLLAERSTAARAVSEAALEQLRGHTADAGTTAALRAVVTALPGLEPQ